MAADKLYRPVKIGSLELPGNLFLAPVAGYTDRAFRSICAEMGADFSFTELVSAEALTRNPGYYGLNVQESMKNSSQIPNIKAPGAVLIMRGSKEKNFSIQLFGAKPDVLGRACALLGPLRPSVIDLNAGCPVPKVIKTGAGSALMKDPQLLARIIEAMVGSSKKYLGGVPVTVKIRSGWDNNSINCQECARIAVEAGAAMVSLHPRTRSQGYGGKSDWSLIADLASLLPVPVTGSGDLYTPEDARRMLAETGCRAIMFARGALGNPQIFKAAKSYLLSGSSPSPPETIDRLGFALQHLEMLAEDLGETKACLEMRKQFCAYTKGIMGFPGIKNGAVLRQKIVRAGTIAEYREILSYYMK